MRYFYVADRIKKVIKSCGTLEQLNNANRYCGLLLNKFKLCCIDDEYTTQLKLWELEIYCYILVNYKRKCIVK